MSESMEFKTLEDIQKRFDIAPDMVLNHENFSHGIWPYRLYRAEANCQYEKNGKQCSQAHQVGFVVQRKDEAVVLIGHCCAYNHLSLDDTTVRKGFKELEAEERLASRRRRVESMLKQRDSLENRAETLHTRHSELQSQVSSIRDALPHEVMSKLTERWKGGRLDVIWDYQIIKEGLDENGKKTVERSWYPSTYGKLQGLGLWLQLKGQRYAELISDFRKELRKIPVNKQLNDSEIDHAETTFAGIAEIERVEREIETQFKLLGDFLSESNLVLTIQLNSNQSIRAETVVGVHKLTGQKLTQKPQQFVTEIDQELKRRHGANSVRIHP
ncbi:hypothetical protein [Pseudomonas sp. 8O]|uniref:hypothetical protein n=1 Tax=Pseudomonas sp. 8O TaxID=2653165 RepID=UPI0012F01BC4|nr:hypothetical protein [Pseudomonas sp. 8O]VXB17501.1 conserved hypothetical protein [Pseudomonas sp. 8O]